VTRRGVRANENHSPRGALRTRETQKRMSVVTSIHGVELGTRAGLTFSGHGADAEQRDLTAPTAAHCSRTAHRTHTVPETRLSSRHDRN
jgi:hypothetical protein